MTQDYLLLLEERSAKLWGVISQLEAKRVAALEAYALKNDHEAGRAARRYAERIKAAEEANEALEAAIETERKGRKLIMPNLSTEEEITIIHRAYHRGWGPEKTQRFIQWVNRQRKASATR